MLKEVSYNQHFGRQKRKRAYEHELRLIKEFLATEKNNVRFEYTNAQEATMVANSLRRYAKEDRVPVKIAQRAAYVFAIKKEDVAQCTN